MGSASACFRGGPPAHAAFLGNPSSGHRPAASGHNIRGGQRNSVPLPADAVKPPNCKEEFHMGCDCTNANKAIECTVTNCKNHCATANYCSLDKVVIGTHEANPTMDQCTDCKSFQMK